METITKKYRVGADEYELVTAYLGWVPKGFKTWMKWYLNKENKKFSDKNYKIGDPDPTKDVTLISPEGKEITLLLDNDGDIVKEAFGHEIDSEERFNLWWDFHIVSYPNKPQVKFIIPMH